MIGPTLPGVNDVGARRDACPAPMRPDDDGYVQGLSR